MQQLYTKQLKKIKKETILFSVCTGTAIGHANLHFTSFWHSRNYSAKKETKGIVLDDLTDHSAVRASSFPSSNGLRLVLSVAGTPCSLCSLKRSTLRTNMPANKNISQLQSQIHIIIVCWYRTCCLYDYFHVVPVLC
jgi:hypothetical protein